MDAQNNWSDRTEFAMEQNEINTTNNIDQGAAITASPASRVFDEDFFKQNFSTTRRAIQGRNAYAAWARKLGLTKKDDPEFLRIHEELRRAGENLDKVLANLGDIPLFKLPASEKELDAMIQKPKATAPSQVKAAQPIDVSPPSQDRSDSASQGKKSNKRTRDSEGFISSPKHLTRKAPKAINNPELIDDAPTPDPDVDRTNNTGNAKQPIRKQPPPPPRPDISGYRKVEPTLQYSAALRGETMERPRATLPPPPRATGDARFNAGMLKDLFEMIADTS
ncbi:hypothetical protein NPIL_640621, partial [Nephila pilipes]